MTAAVSKDPGFDLADSKLSPRLVAKPIASTPARCKRRSNSVASTAYIGLDHMAQLHRLAQGDRNLNHRVAGERRLDGLAGQRLALAGE